MPQEAVSNNPVEVSLAKLMQSVLERLASGEPFNQVIEDTGITSKVSEAVRQESTQAFLVVQEGGSSTELYVHSFDTDKDAQAFRASCGGAAYRTTTPISIPGALAASQSFWPTLSDVLNSLPNMVSVETED